MTRIQSTTAAGVLSLLSTILFLLALPQHARVKNTGTLIMIAWGSLGTFTFAVSCFLLQDTETQFTPSLLRWFDFATAIQYVYPFGFGAGMLILLQKLECIASTRQVSQTSRGKKRTLVWEVFLGVVLPLLLVPLRFICQGHRTDIITGYICNAPLYISVPALFLAILPPFILSTINLVYACVLLRWFIIRRRQFAALLHSSGTGLSKRRYVRLMSLAMIEILISWPIQLWSTIYNIKIVGFRPYVSWDYVHANFGQVYMIDYDSSPTSVKASVELLRWTGIVSAIVFFVFFGMTGEAWKQLVSTAQSSMQRFSKSSKSTTDVSVEQYAAKEASSVDIENLSQLDTPKSNQSDWMTMSHYHVSKFPPSSNILVSSERVVVT